MYTLPLPDKKLTDGYFRLYAPVIQNEAKKFLSTKYFIMSRAKKGFRLKVKYKGNSMTPTGQFLTSILNDADLEVLLTGSLNDIITKFPYLFSDKLNRKKASKTKYPKKKKYNIVEDLNEIAYEIFVNKGYESALDKTALIKEKGILMCPYCGCGPIEPYYKDKNKIIKPNIDHYLPKGEFPWLAMNYHNLVPACQECNAAPNKHIHSPMSEDLNKTYLPHPYLFDDDSCSFRSFKCLPEMKRKEQDMDLRIDYRNNDDLKRGYNKIIGIEPKYKTLYFNRTAYSIWQSVVRNTSKYRKFSKALIDSGSTKDAMELFPTPLNVLNFEIDARNSQTIPEYKFRKDLYHQFIADIFTKKVF